MHSNESEKSKVELGIFRVTSSKHRKFFMAGWLVAAALVISSASAQETSRGAHGSYRLRGRARRDGRGCLQLQGNSLCCSTSRGVSLAPNAALARVAGRA